MTQICEQIDLSTLIKDMIHCKQTENQSIYQHGLSVQSYFNRLKTILQNNEQDSALNLPDWFFQYRNEILRNLHPQEITDLYTLYHDCGKPYCLEIDSQGRRHFPNHAQVSYETFLGISPLLIEDKEQAHIIANLIRDDMVLHTSTAEEIKHHLNTWPKKDAMTLLIAALAEIHSNAELFGGIESTSFKIKFKKINKRGKQICKFYFGGKK